MYRLGMQVCCEAESAVFHSRQFNELRLVTESQVLDASESAAISSVEAADRACAAAICVITTTGRLKMFL